MAWAAEAKAAKDIPLTGSRHGNNGLIKIGETITITKSSEENNYLLWHNSIWLLPEEYIGEIIKILSTT